MNKKILALVFLSITGIANAVDSDIFGNATALLEKLSGSMEKVREMRTQFSSAGATMDAKMGNFDDRAKEFQTFFDCARETFGSLQSDIAMCVSQKESDMEKCDIDRRSIQAEIDALIISTNVEISDLKNAMSQSEKQIEKYKIELATLAGLNAEAVTQAITDLTAIRSEYQLMLVDRASFAAKLDAYKSRLQADNQNTANGLQSLKDDICVNEPKEEKEPVIERTSAAVGR